MKIRKAVIPVAGIGTRFLPITKVVPKELLPIGGKPVIQYLVEEAVASGIREIVFVLSPEKEMIRQYFSADPKLVKRLKARGKEDLVKKIEPLHRLAHFHYAYQRAAKGDGDAILYTEQFIGDEPFLVLFGDDLIVGEIPAAKQLIDAFKGGSVIGVTEIRSEESRRYGVVEPYMDESEGAKTFSRLHFRRIRNLIEKPAPKDAPSNLGVIGKYVCTPLIFSALKHAKKGADGELRLADGFIELLKTESVWALKIKGKRFDTGRPEGLLAANLAFSLKKF